jgi:hypothetical protein
MARIRYLKPDFFKDEDIKELSFEARLFYQGLWVMADKEGRGEDRPERLKIEIMPYDEVDAEKIMETLASNKKNGKRAFIKRYEVDGEKYYQIINWHKHQKPHKTEKETVIPPVPNVELTVKEPLTNGYETIISVVKENGDGKGNGEGNGEGIVYRQPKNNGKACGKLPTCGQLEGNGDGEDKSKEKLKEKEKLKDKAKEMMEKVYRDGFNIYQLINKFKKDAKWRKGDELPCEVLIRICEEYGKEKAKGKIKKPYPWFIKVLKMESAAYFSNRNEKKGQEFKDEGVGKLRDVLREIIFDTS